jgi:hypothetical protein
MSYLRSTAPGGDKDEACVQAGVAKAAERVKLVRSAPVPDPVRRSEAMTGLQSVSGKSPSRYYVTRVKGESTCCRQRILLKIRAFQSIGSSRHLAEELLSPVAIM